MTRSQPHRVLVLTDSDSYVKWGAALASRLPSTWQVRFAVARGSAEPSQRQVAEAVAGTRISPGDIETLGLDDLRETIASWRPDVLIAAARGLTVQVALELAVDNVPQRPVIVTGLPGIALPVLPYGLGFRRGVDLFIVHSHREVRAFTEASAALQIPHRFALARLPFLPAPHGPRSTGRDTRIVFAAQSLVPETPAERVFLLERLAATARAHPDTEVVVKVRGSLDEPQTHADPHPYPELLEQIEAPDNLVVEAGSMSDQLARARGLVTVSSTAVLEALAAGVPALALTDFGVNARQINVVFEGSGLLHEATELVAGRFHHADPNWLADNYFHDPDDDTWLTEIESLLDLRARDGLAPLALAPDGLRHRLTMFFYRHQAFTGETGPVRRRLEQAVVTLALRVSRSSWVVSRRFKPARTAPMGDGVSSSRS